MKYYLIAGEASGDLHGSNLMKSIKNIDEYADFRFWEVIKCCKPAGNIVEHYRNMAFMGFLEVFRNIIKILDYIKKCKQDIISFKPDVLILIDYPGFNLRIAKWAKKNHIKIVYYITPQVWAWHKNRVHSLGKYTDKLLVILPFESEFFKKYGIETSFVGHPLLDEIRDFKANTDFLNRNAEDRPVLALLPGSRLQEISSILPVMLRAIDLNKYMIYVAGTSSIDPELYKNIIKKNDNGNQIKLIIDRTYDLLSVADVALVGSGTATLETALFDVPQIVCYKGNPISFRIAKFLVDLKYISLVNIISGKEVVKELIQNEFNSTNVKIELEKLKNKTIDIKKDYAILKDKLGTAGASDNAALIINQLLLSY
ncbi:MAG: lipid-A-disaccharide synthase [Saprospiraceae bacterium]|nr:lipid-A-disaccharide synthase [Saprospiraceae bacterium]